MIIGREKELQTLQVAYDSDYSEFVVVYGRRRVGKTFLVREKFNYQFTFQHAGLANEGKRQQLTSFRDSLVKQGFRPASVPATWFEAFNLLEEFIAASPDSRKVVFIDEMPWMETPQSHFVPALEHFWNGFASARKDVLLIVCGSATSWIVKNVFNNHGGLHNRVTRRIHLHPFTLHECELLAQARQLALSRYDLLQCYMVMGGVPFYWNGLKKGLSVSQNIDTLFFARDGELRNEFNALYASLYTHPETYVRVISALAAKRIGMTRNEIIEAGRLASSGKLSVVLENLENCDFIRSYQGFGASKKCTIYQLTDNFTLFYFKFMANHDGEDEHFWSHMERSSQRAAWQGLAFEQVCFAHLSQIKQSLGISGVMTKAYSWRALDDEERGPGTQIDLIIERADKVINLCEIKFAAQEYLIDKAYDMKLRWKRARFVNDTGTRASVHLTFISTFGLVPNGYANEVQSQVTADDLFLPTRDRFA